MTKYLFLLSLLAVCSGLIFLLIPDRYNDFRLRLRSRFGFLKSKKKKEKVWDSKRRAMLRIKGGVYFVIGITWLFMAQTSCLVVPESKVVAEYGNLSTKIEDTIKTFAAEENAAGLVVGIIDNNQDTLCLYGYSDLDEKVPVEKNTLFEIGSVTKIFTGIMLSKAINDGKVRIDDNVGAYLTKGKTNNQLKAIKLRHLATHTAGLPRVVNSLSVFPVSTALTIFLSNPYSVYTEDDVLDYLSGLSISDKPGEKYSYSNIGTGLLGYILAGAYRTDFEHMLKENVFSPFKMEDTCIRVKPDTSAMFAKGYAGLLKINPLSDGPHGLHLTFTSKPWDMTDIIAGAGAIRSTGSDMMKFLKICINSENDFVSNSMIPIFKDEDDFENGMCWGIIKMKKMSEPLIYHDGGTGGFRSFIGILKGKKSGVVILSNSVNKVSRLGVRILRLLDKK